MLLYKKHVFKNTCFVKTDVEEAQGPAQSPDLIWSLLDK